jgi:carboxypeptidase family protein
VHLSRHGLLSLIAVIGATACGGGATGVLPLPPCSSSATSGVFGCVTNTRGGPAISGAAITASGTAVSATTNPQGAYTLPLNPGTYDIVAAKSGMAASKFQAVAVLAGQSTTANLIMFPVFDPTKPVAAPTLAVANLVPGQQVVGTITFTVTVTAANVVRRIDARVNDLDLLPLSRVADSPAATFTLNSTVLSNGPGFVDLIAYDLNNNAVETVIRFIVNNPVSGTPPAMPTMLNLVAVTTGQSLGLFRAQRATAFSTLGIPGDPNAVPVAGHTVNILAAPPNATLFVEISWSSGSGATGYKVFRSFSPGGPFIEIAQVTQSLNPFYDDADSALAPGVSVSYQVSAFNAGGESTRTSFVSVTPLAVFNVNLTSPANNATGVSKLPTFIWTPTALIGMHQFYDISLIGVNDATPTYRTDRGTLVDTTSLSYPAVALPLTALTVYMWDIWQAQGQTVYGQNSAAVALANGGGILGRPGGSLNGPFKFTTAP